MEKNHAILLASSSARLELEFEDYESVASQEETATYALDEHKLKKLKMRSARPVSKYNDDDLEIYIDDYADYVFEQYKRAKRYDENTQIFIEQRLDFSCYVPEEFRTGMH